MADETLAYYYDYKGEYMKKRTAMIYIKIDTGRWEQAEGYEVMAWNAPQLVTKHRGYWQVYDIDSGLPTVSVGEPSRKLTLERLRMAEKDIFLETYQQCVASAKQSQGRIDEHEESISFAINSGRWA